MKQTKTIHFMTIFLTVFILSPILSTQETAIPDMTYVLAMTIPPIIYSISSHQNKQLKPYHIAIFFLPVLAFFSSALSDYGELDLRFLKYILLVIYFVVITNYFYTGRDLLIVGKVYILLSIILSILIILSYQFGYAHNDSTYYMGRYSIGITGLYKNPNYITSFMNLALFVLIYRMLFSKLSKLQVYVTAAVFVLFFVSFYLSGTRASLVTLFIYGFVLFLFYISNNNKNGKIVSILLALSLLVPITYWTIVNYDQIAFWVDMFVGNRDLLNDESRFNTWGLALNKLSESLFLGQGLFSWQHFYIGGDDLKNMHNLFIEFLLYQGVVGFIVLLFVILSGYSKIKKQDRVFVYGFLFVTAFPLLFQNGLIDVNFFKFLIMNRIVVNYSTYSKEGIVALLK